MAVSRQVKNDYLWNTLGSMMNAASSVILLMLVTQCLGAYEGGVFALAFAVAQQFQVLGQYEMRPYQATDVSGKFPFGVYYASRIVTCALMLVGAAAYAAYSTGIGPDFLLLVLVAVMRCFDAFEDVYHGMLQQKGRLDLAGRAFFGRVLATVLSFAAALIISRDIAAACIVSIAVSSVALAALNIPVARRFEKLRPCFDLVQLKQLLVTCFPLFLAAFLLMYLVNAPRYGIEEFLSKEYQTYYASLFMPAMVINLLSGFIFKPLLTTMAKCWEGRRWGQFRSILMKGLLVVAGTTAFALLVGWFVGIPVLSFFYGVDLSAFRAELLVLLVGGGFNAASVILYYGLVTMRRQKLMLVGYVVVSVLVLAFSRFSIATLGIMGAALLYDGAMALLVVLFAVFNAATMRRA